MGATENITGKAIAQCTIKDLRAPAIRWAHCAKENQSQFVVSTIAIARLSV
jgi:hypothetical protein